MPFTLWGWASMPLMPWRGTPTSSMAWREPPASFMLWRKTPMSIVTPDGWSGSFIHYCSFIRHCSFVRYFLCVFFFFLFFFFYKFRSRGWVLIDIDEVPSQSSLLKAEQAELQVSLDSDSEVLGTVYSPQYYPGLTLLSIRDLMGSDGREALNCQGTVPTETRTQVLGIQSLKCSPLHHGTA
ncbi:hypothetical protein WISP_78907 [Willisornis vidua]|uniref:Uncharacterized protein n=1 Tax=Willisornis vidua TaxID=1566151 RepID=A0ABQ9DBA2_9PASS|nr:hypothetical protein WISP_78907 [Willisornis vidua]